MVSTVQIHYFCIANLKFYMRKKTVGRKSETLVKAVIEVIKEHKGKEVVSLDLRGIETAVSDYFIVCHGTSNTHISSLADNVRKDVSKKIKEKPWHIEGESNKEWVLLDYFDVVVSDEEGRPVNEAIVTLYKNDEYSISSETDEFGRAYFNVDYQELGNVIVTSRCYNCVPSETSFEITNALPDVVLLSDSILIDDSQGNSDSIINPGEIVDLTFSVENLSDSFAGLVNISPSSLGPSVTSKLAAMAFACSKENSGPPSSAKFL